MQTFMGHAEENSAMEAKSTQSEENSRAISEILPFTLFWLSGFSTYITIDAYL